MRTGVFPAKLPRKVRSTKFAGRRLTDVTEKHRGSEVRLAASSLLLCPEVTEHSKPARPPTIFGILIGKWNSPSSSKNRWQEKKSPTRHRAAPSPMRQTPHAKGEWKKKARRTPHQR